MTIEQKTATEEHVLANFPLSRGIPLPVSRTGRFGATRIYPFVMMEIGESFFVAKRSRQGFNGSSNYATQKLGRKFATRAVVENGVKGTRVWRTA